jgi:hypothetical protein
MSIRLARQFASRPDHVEKSRGLGISSVSSCLLFDLAAETLRIIAAACRDLNAQIGVTLLLHTWGSALTYHPMSMASSRAAACKPGFFLPVALTNARACADWLAPLRQYEWVVYYAKRLSGVFSKLTTLLRKAASRTVDDLWSTVGRLAG